MLKRSKRILIVTLCLVMVLTSMFALTLSTSANSANILRPHLSWNTSDTATTMTVTWETAANTTSTVNYGTVSGSLTSWKAGSSFYSSGLSKYVHTVTLTGLTPNTKYYYNCGASPDWSVESSFYTAPSVGSTTAYRIGVITDTQNNAGTANANWAIYSGLASRLAGYNPDFVIHAGDITTDSGYAPLLQEFLNASNTMFTKAPFMPAPGNHDCYYTTSGSNVRGNLVQGYKDIFTLPGNETYYSYNYGNAHVTNIFCGEAHEDGPVAFKPGTAQYDWIVSDLSSTAAQSAQWLIVNIHMPPFGSGSASNTGVRTYLAPLFDQYDVDVVIDGHAHFYERCKPVNGVVSVDAASGGGSFSTGSVTSETAVYKQTYSFSVVDVAGGNLTWHAYDNNGAQIDSFTLTKTAPPPSGDLFNTGLEPSETSPTWYDTIDTAAGNISNVSGYISGVGPECGPRANGEPAHTGTYALMTAGTDNSTSTSYAYFKSFDVNIPVSSTTKLSYWIDPQQDNGRYVGVDLVFTDGTQLRNLGAVDQYGYSMHPAAGHGGSIALNAWTFIQSDIGSKAAGKTIDRILVGYDHGPATGQFRTYLDEIRLYNP